jgi:proteic killer suppression protein
MIINFACKLTEAIWNREHVKQFSPELQRMTRRKLLILDAVATIEELRSPPGNRLEKLSGDRQGAYSIRVNAQWRICFYYHDGMATDVQLVDYH